MGFAVSVYRWAVRARRPTPIARRTRAVRAEEYQRVVRATAGITPTVGERRPRCAGQSRQPHDGRTNAFRPLPRRQARRGRKPVAKIPDGRHHRRGHRHRRQRGRSSHARARLRRSAAINYHGDRHELAGNISLRGARHARLGLRRVQRRQTSQRGHRHRDTRTQDDDPRRRRRPARCSAAFDVRAAQGRPCRGCASWTDRDGSQERRGLQERW